MSTQTGGVNSVYRYQHTLEKHDHSVVAKCEGDEQKINCQLEVRLRGPTLPSSDASDRQVSGGPVAVAEPYRQMPLEQTLEIQDRVRRISEEVGSLLNRMTVKYEHRYNMAWPQRGVSQIQLEISAGKYTLDADCRLAALNRADGTYDSLQGTCEYLVKENNGRILERDRLVTVPVGNPISERRSDDDLSGGVKNEEPRVEERLKNVLLQAVLESKGVFSTNRVPV